MFRTICSTIIIKLIAKFALDDGCLMHDLKIDHSDSFK